MNTDDSIEKINQLYNKEREYQLRVFGDYKNIKSLNLASFLILIKNYLEKAEKYYSGPWSKELPPWLNNCQEFYDEGSAPVETYEELIKIFALTGAALETYAEFNLDEWRKDITEKLKKWEKGESE